MKRYLILVPVALGIIIIVAVGSVIWGFIAHSTFTLRYVFNVTFFVGVVLIASSVVAMFLPSSFIIKFGSKMLDKSTFVERSYDSRENRQQKARIVLWTGFLVVLLTGLIQLLLSFIVV